MVDVRRRVVNPVPKRDFYSIMFFFDRKSIQYVSKHRHLTCIYGMSKGYLPKIGYQKEVYNTTAKYPVPTCALVCVTLFGKYMSMYRNVMVISSNAMKGTKIVIISNVQ